MGVGALVAVAATHPAGINFAQSCLVEFGWHGDQQSTGSTKDNTSELEHKWLIQYHQAVIAIAILTN